jgi:uncharacterized protein YyaL (SSP411 family)
MRCDQALGQGSWLLWLWLVACVPGRGPGALPQPSQVVSASAAEAPAWRGFDAAAFGTARRERKLILLSVQAGFCHWCHVMNATTYRDGRVLALLRERFVSVRVDESERPDLAARYADFGWPATAILSPDAAPIMTLRGHRAPGPFLDLLREALAHPDGATPVAVEGEPPLGVSALLDAHARALAQLDALFDRAQGGWGGPQKYPFAAPVEHALVRAFSRAETARGEQALLTLRGHAQLIDPEAGGMFQYSLGGVWTAPHYEKLASIQAGGLSNFAAAHQASGDPRWRDAAQQLARYVLETLRLPSGAFAASQSADVGELGAPTFMEGARYYALDAEARAHTPAPTLDRHVYANLNGLLIQSLCALDRAGGEARALPAAQAALTSILATHARGRAFAHAADDVSGRVFLSDQVEMIGALWCVADATGDVSLRVRAFATMDFVLESLQDAAHGGFFAHSPDAAAAGVFAHAEKPVADNARLARLILRRARLEHDARLDEVAQRTLRSASDPGAIARQGRKVGDLLLALEEATSDYVMFSVVGPATDARTRALWQAAAHAYAPHALLRVDEPGLALYPYPGEPALYLCSASACSAPVSDPAALPAALAAFVQSAREQ